MRRRPLVALAALVIFVAFPVALGRLAGGPAVPRLTTLHALRSFVTAGDDTALTAAIVRNVVRIAWMLWAYLALSTIGTGVVQVLDRLGHPSLRRAWERVQPRSVIAAANLLLVVGVSMAPRVAQAAVPSAPVAMSVPQLPEAVSPRLVPTSAPVASPPTARYIVQRGDTLWEIASRECGSPLLWHEVADANGITDPGRLVAGQQLVLPAGCTVAPTLTVVVQERDSLTSIAQREYGRAGAWAVIWDANRGMTMADGQVFADPNKILPGWLLTLPTPPATASLPSSSGTDPAPPPAPVAPVPAAPPSAATAPPSAATAAPSPDAVRPTAHSQSVANAKDPARGATTAGHRFGIEVPGGLIPPVVGAGALALVVLARRRRRARLPLDHPETFRPDGPQLTAIRRSEVGPAFDRLEAHTAGVLAVLRSSSHAVPPVIAAWDDSELDAGTESVRFLLADADDVGALQGQDPETGVSVSCCAVDGRVVARTTRPGGRQALESYAPLLVENLLVPVGVRPGDGWLHIPLLGPAIAVTGQGAEELATGLLFAAAQRAGQDDLAVVIADGLLLEASTPEGLDLPEYERMAAAQLGERLASECEERSRWLAGERGCETFAQACAVSSHPALVLVVDATQLEAHSAVLNRLGSLGVGVLVLEETPLASRRLHLNGGALEVSGPELGSFGGLVPYGLPPALVEELRDATFLEPDEAPEVEQGKEDVALPDAEAPAEIGEGEAPVQIRLLGAYRVVREGEERPKPANQPRELVARLAVDGCPIEAGDLRELLWPDEVDVRTSDRRRRSLNSVISRGRSWLGGSEHLVECTPDGGAYRLAGVWVDVLSFRAAVARGDYAKAVSLYAGDLLPGVTWEWVDRVRDRERSRYFGAVAGLGQQLLANGDAEGAVAALEPALEGEGGAVEALVQLAMRAESAAGNPDGVRRRLRQLTAALRQDPSAETMALAADLIASHSNLQRPRPALRLIEEGEVHEAHAVAGR